MENQGVFWELNDFNFGIIGVQSYDSEEINFSRSLKKKRQHDRDTKHQFDDRMLRVNSPSDCTLGMSMLFLRPWLSQLLPWLSHRVEATCCWAPLPRASDFGFAFETWTDTPSETEMANAALHVLRHFGIRKQIDVHERFENWSV